MDNYIWLIPVLPLAGFIINGLGRNALSEKTIGFIGSFLVLISFGISVGAFLQIQSDPAHHAINVHIYDWIKVGGFQVPFSFLVDQLSSLMLLIITGVGFLIHLYSIGYMHNDAGFGKFFAYLNLFVFFMLLLVMGSNYIIMFIGWEGVGLCSYLLIGFWYTNPSYADAAKKAFVMNRIGDLGFLLAIFLIGETFKSFAFADVFPKAVSMHAAPFVLITILLFVGATGKSAQIPLFTWLPDAMAGPTPVSALIHAATMVTAGIYMIARSNILFTLAPDTMHIIAIIGLATAVFAALIALTQTDIKKVLAYSTVSQLGYMFLGLGVGAYTGAFFHLMTHAFFKGLLFLGAGSVIHGVSGEQDMRKMGGLKSKLPITFVTMLVGTLAISGIPPFSGFFSKDEILSHAFAQSPTLYIIGVIGAMLTAFYMFRMLFLTFYGKFRGTHEQEHHLHESPASMTIPLIVLALLSAFGGLLGIPGEHHWLQHWLAPVFAPSTAVAPLAELSSGTEYMLMCISVGAAVLSIIYAYIKYNKNAHVPIADTEERSFLANLSYNKFYVDEIYDVLVRKPLDALSGLLYKVDRKGIDGLVNGIGDAPVEASKGLRLLQTGNVGFYIFMMVAGIIAILVYSLVKI